MPPQGRLGDNSRVDADAHGCPACAHTCVGPAIVGSPNVFVNSKPALRIGDTGVHAACCGPNTWKAVEGAPHVFINSRAAHRKDDQDQHCGGVGKMIEGSPNVVVGNGSDGARPTSRMAPTYDRRFVLTDEETGAPLPDVPYKLTLSDGSVVRGRTDELGRTSSVGSDQPDVLQFELDGQGTENDG